MSMMQVYIINLTARTTGIQWVSTTTWPTDTVLYIASRYQYFNMMQFDIIRVLP